MSTDDVMDLDEDNDLYEGVDFEGVDFEGLPEEDAEEGDYYDDDWWSSIIESVVDLSIAPTEQTYSDSRESGRDDIGHVETLRAEYARQGLRKTAAMNMLVILFKKGLCKVDVLPGTRTKEEETAHYESLVMKFKEKKEAKLKKVDALKEMISTKTQSMISKETEWQHLKNKQLDLELKTAMTAMIENNTRQPMSYHDVLSITDGLARSNEALSKLQLKFITVKNKCKRLRSEIAHLKSIYDFDSYLELVDVNEILVRRLQRQKYMRAKTVERVDSVRKYTKEIDKELTKLTIQKESKTEKLSQLKQESERYAKIKTRNREILIRRTVAGQWKYRAAADRRLRRDYHECVAKAEENKKIVAELRQKLAESQANLNFLKAISMDREADNEIEDDL